MSIKQRKVAILGYRSVGKSSLVIQFVDKQFVDSYDPTIENTFSKSLQLRGQEYSVTIMDTAGQEEHYIMPAHYTMDVHGYMLVYSINSLKSFEIVQLIHSRLVELTGHVRVPLVLVGNKTDLHREREIPLEEGKRLAESWGALFLETSAKRNLSVTEIFTQLLTEIDRMDGTLPKENTCSLQ